MLQWTKTGDLLFFYSPDGTLANRVTLTANWTPTVGAWHHVAVDRDSANRLRVYVDGRVPVDTVVTAAFHDSTYPFSVGTHHAGWIDEVRVTKGVALYGGTFAPPIQPLTTTHDLRLNNPHVTYLYEDSRFSYALTGITDETGQRTTSWSYNAEGRGLSSELAGGVDAVALAYNADGTKTLGNSGDTILFLEINAQ